MRAFLKLLFLTSMLFGKTLFAEKIEQNFKLSQAQEVKVVVGDEKRIIKVRPGDELHISFEASSAQPNGASSAAKSACVSAYGQTQCGYGCTSGYGQVKCGSVAGMTCLAGYGQIKCGYGCASGYGDVECSEVPGGTCAAAHGKVTCFSPSSKN